MNFLQLAKKRYSCRSYKTLQVEEAKIQLVLEAARIAPSAVNFQPWSFIVIKESENLQEIYSCYHREWFNQAPVVIIACGNKETAWKRKADNKNHVDIDLAIAIDHITLQATELDLATCWVCNFEPEKVKTFLNLPENVEPIALISLGYPTDIVDTERHTTKRNSLDEIVGWERY